MLSGCTGGSTNAAKTSTALPQITGNIHGGQQPVSGAVLQLYSAGTGGDGSAATPLIGTRLTTSDGTGNATNSNANAGNLFNTLPAGSFTISGDYSCASAGEVYLVGTGGNPGLGTGMSNPNLAMMAALGNCNNLSTATLYVDELTTVGSVAALAGYMNGYAALGSGTSDAAPLNTAFALVNEYTNVTTGAVPGPTLPAGYYASSTEIDSLADILATCINSSGGHAGDGTMCGLLFTQATPPGSGSVAPTDTIGAIVDILKNPTNDVGGIYGLLGAGVPYQPTLTGAPASWALPILPLAATPTFSLMAGSYAGAQMVTLSSTTNGATIYYTTDGTTPTSASTVYSGAITVAASETVNAIAVAPGFATSAVGSVSYTITAPMAGPPAFLPVAGTYTSTQMVTLSSTTSMTTIYYTTDGTNPTAASSVYSSAIPVTVSETVNAIAVATGYTNSAQASAAYVIHPYGVISTYAGNGTYASSGDNGPATSASMRQPSSVALDSAGNLYIADNASGYVKKVTPSGTISNYAGNGSYGYSGDGNQATLATLGGPYGLALDASGNLYISENGKNRIRMVNTAGVISTVAGNGSCAFAGDGMQATSAALCTPEGIVVDNVGNLYIADSQNYRVRMVNTSGVISTVAGNGMESFSGDNGPATSAALYQPYAVTLDGSGNLYIADPFNRRVRKVDTTGMITTYAGNGSTGHNGDGAGAATNANLTFPQGLSVDSSGNLFIADSGNALIMKVTAAGAISIVTGNVNNAGGFSGDGGLATSAQISNPSGVVVDSSTGNFFIADTSNERVRKVTYQATAPH